MSPIRSVQKSEREGETDRQTDRHIKRKQRRQSLREFSWFRTSRYFVSILCVSLRLCHPGPSRLASSVCRCVQPVLKCLPSPGFQLAVWKRVGRGLFTKQQNLGIAYLVKLHMKKGKERPRRKYREKKRNEM